MTVWKVLDRIKNIEVSIDELLKLDNDELKHINTLYLDKRLTRNPIKRSTPDENGKFVSKPS